MQSRFDSIAAAKAWDGARIPPNQECLILVNGIWNRWRFAVGSSAVDVKEYVVFAPTTNGAVGKWVLTGNSYSFKMPWAFNTPDNTVLFTVPTGFRFFISHSTIAEIATDVEGNDGHSMGLGTNRTLDFGGVSAFSGLPNAGDFIGNDGGDLYDPPECILLPGDTFLHQQAGGTPLYTAGTGFWHVACEILQL